MPRIDPLQLLNCLAVLLTPNGGILSTEEVQRLANLMRKFSKKLVSKCVYVLILKNTERNLLGLFMASEGWSLIQVWLQDAMFNKNWALVKELLELLLVTPVDVERLKVNNIPKLVKSLSKREDLPGINELSNQLVQQWLRIVKDETRSEFIIQRSVSPPGHMQLSASNQLSDVPVIEVESDKESEIKGEALPPTIDTKTFYKLTVRDGKQVLSKINTENVDCKSERVLIDGIETGDEQKENAEDKDEKSKKSSSKSSSHSSSRDKERRSSKDYKDRHKSSSNSSSRDRSKSKDKDRRDKDGKDKHRDNGSLKSSSKSGKDREKDRKERKESQAEKDKDTLSKIQPQSLQKLPKIPKKGDDKSSEKKDKKEDAKKGSISIEVRKTTEERPKTVKVYKAKMRSTGLEEEAKPAPPRSVKKSSSSSSSSSSSTPNAVSPVLTKRSSPVKDVAVPEKKSKLDLLDRSGTIKLIPPKPKPPVLQESDMFMDALTASANPKKEPKKRKRRPSVSKEANASSSSPPQSPSVTGPANGSTLGLKGIAPPKFYQDTLETDENNKSESQDGEDGDRTSSPVENMDFESNDNVKEGGIKGVLVTVKRKGPKKSIRWKADDELVDIQYFELDETERVNVSKPFLDLAKMDARGEREAIQLSRKPLSDDSMEPQTSWRIPSYIELPEALAEPGSKSLEKDIQFAREKHVLTFFSRMHQDTPSEPDPENYQIKDPIMIPVEDTDNSEHDFRNTPWPEPKGSPPPPVQAATPNAAAPFPNMPATPFPNFMGPPPGFQGIPPFANTNVMPPTVPNMMGAMLPMGPPDMMNQPNMFGPQGGPPNNAMIDNPRFIAPFNQAPPFPPNNFNRGGFRRGGGTGPWLRMNGPGPGGPGNWNMRGTGGPHRGGRLCNNVRNKGFCRNRDTCPFFHPNN